MSLQDKIAFVTGGSRGIGRAIVLSLAQEGATVVAVARNEDKLNEVVKEAEGFSGKVVPKIVDIGESKQLSSAIEETVEKFGRLDILVNNAGITRDGLLIGMEDDQFDEVININLRSAFIAMKAAAKVMIRQRFGRIFNITSISGVMGNPGQCNYSAAKAGMIGLTKSGAKELAKRGVTVNAIAPGFITTDMTENLPDKLKDTINSVIPMQRFGKPEEIASVVKFFASEASSYVTGQVLIVDGGLHM